MRKWTHPSVTRRQWLGVWAVTFNSCSNQTYWYPIKFENFVIVDFVPTSGINFNVLYIVNVVDLWHPLAKQKYFTVRSIGQCLPTVSRIHPYTAFHFPRFRAAVIISRVHFIPTWNFSIFLQTSDSKYKLDDLFKFCAERLKDKIWVIFYVTSVHWELHGFYCDKKILIKQQKSRKQLQVR